jgi:betaine-aldehyde dehydrogenase
METRLLIGGESAAGGGTPLDVEDPATGAVLETLATASAEQIDAALASARDAQPGWERTPAAERGELLHAAAWLREHTEEIAVAMTREGGKPLLENRDEVGWTAACFDFYAELGRAHAGRVIPPVESTQLALVLKEPVGVVACVVPWNYPLLLLAWKLAPALAAGNTCVCKTSARCSSPTSAWTASPSRAASRRARRSPARASTASRGCTSSSAARIRSSSAPTSRRRSRSPRAAARGPRT